MKTWLKISLSILVFLFINIIFFVSYSQYGEVRQVSFLLSQEYMHSIDDCSVSRIIEQKVDYANKKIGPYCLNPFLRILVTKENSCAQLQKRINNVSENLFELKKYCTKLNNEKSSENIEKNKICGNLTCSEYQSCINNKCSLDSLDYKLGLVYVYNNKDTYNSNWKGEFEEINKKVEKGIKESTNNKINASITILGEVKTDNFCWNPARIGVICQKDNSSSNNIYYDKLPDSSFVGGEPTLYCNSIKFIDCENCKAELVKKEESSYGNKICNKGDEKWETMPGKCNSNFKTFYCDGSTGNLTIDCTLCGCENNLICDEYSGRCMNSLDNKLYKIKSDCENPLYQTSLFESYRFGLLKEQISSELNFNFENYDGIFIIIGNYGYPLKNDPLFLEWDCNKGFGYPIIGGYSNLVMAENFIKSDGGLIDCSTTHNKRLSYEARGWHSMVHEILHKLGALDVYDTGTAFGLENEKKEASIMDLRINESIMGNNFKSCMEDGNLEKDDNVCTNQELDEIYLDEYNKQKIGLY
ncbi:MAG: hypothetical protein Q7S33_02215 [Nanoarchaeota archaeon]|nr:hypothetical protein [Nanoarchaeota archaeon]